MAGFSVGGQIHSFRQVSTVGAVCTCIHRSDLRNVAGPVKSVHSDGWAMCLLPDTTGVGMSIELCIATSRSGLFPSFLRALLDFLVTPEAPRSRRKLS